MNVKPLLFLGLGLLGGWVVLDEVSGGKRVSSLFSTAKNGEFNAKKLSNELLFIGLFIGSVVVLTTMIGEEAVFWFLLLVLLSMLVTNTQKVTESVDRFSKLLGGM